MMTDEQKAWIDTAQVYATLAVAIGNVDHTRERAEGFAQLAIEALRKANLEGERGNKN